MNADGHGYGNDVGEQGHGAGAAAFGDTVRPRVGPCPRKRESPEFVRLSSAAAMTLGLKRGRFFRHARLHCLNILLTYDNGCLAKCAYCGLSGERSCAEADKNFIRVDWPTHSVSEVLERLRPVPPDIERVCISMVTRRRAVEDVKAVSRRIRECAPDVPVSFLVAPTVLDPEALDREFEEFRASGAERIGIAVDVATPELFERHRGAGVDGPHSWSRYWETVEAAVGVFGSGMVGVHLVVGLGETEREMVEVIGRAADAGAVTHLFSFYPEAGSALEGDAQPGIGHYRRVQLARFLINDADADADGVGARDMSFDEHGRVTGFGVDASALERAIASGLPFRTSGCPGRTVIDGIEVGACNRPFANCRPGDPIRNFPFQPDDEDIAQLRRELAE